MKKKISRNKNKLLVKRIPLEDRLKGVHCFNIVGPCEVTGIKVSALFYGTREDADKVRIVSLEQSGKEGVLKTRKAFSFKNGKVITHPYNGPLTNKAPTCQN